jgi:hypothetical protein
MTGRDLVTASLRLIGATAPGESLAASEATDGLAALNRMLDSWSNDGMLIHAITAETPYTLTVSDGSYTIGASGDITTRPMSIEKAVIRDGTTDYPLMRLTLSEYSAIVDKSQESTYPTHFYDDGGYPQRTIKLWPVPSAAHSLVLWTKRPLTQVATLDTSLSLPQGYERALVYNLAVEVSPEYGKQISDVIMMTAIESKAAIKRSNHRPILLTPDATPAGRSGSFNIYTGDYN